MRRRASSITFFEIVLLWFLLFLMLHFLCFPLPTSVFFPLWPFFSFIQTSCWTLHPLWKSGRQNLHESMCVNVCGVQFLWLGCLFLDHTTHCLTLSEPGDPLPLSSSHLSRSTWATKAVSGISQLSKAHPKLRVAALPARSIILKSKLLKLEMLSSLSWPLYPIRKVERGWRTFPVSQQVSRKTRSPSSLPCALSDSYF